MQTRWQSFVEVNASTAVGFLLSWALTPVVFPLFGWQVSSGQAFGVVCFYTALSMARGWAMRRLFNHLHRSRA